MAPAKTQYTVELVIAGVPKVVTFPRRQFQMLRLLGEELTPRQASRRLGISRRTGEHHLEKARGRAGARTTGQLLLALSEAGVIPKRRPAQPSSTGGANHLVMTSRPLQDHLLEGVTNRARVRRWPESGSESGDEELLTPEAVELDPDSTVALYGWGLTRQALGHEEDARADLTRAANSPRRSSVDAGLPGACRPAARSLSGPR